MTHSKLYTAICVAALAFTGTGVGVHHAHAQKGVMFSSEGGWVTKDLASSKKGALPYCVAAMQFSKNTILTMAENKSGEISMAFDFGGGYFDPSAVAAVILDPGAGQQRSFKVKPRSSKAIVVRLGNDKEFMDALGRTGLMRLEIGDQSLNFNLNDIDVGRRKLNECLDGVIVVSAPNAVPPPNQDLRSLGGQDRQVFADMQSQYEQKIEALERRISQVEGQTSSGASAPVMGAPAAVAAAPVSLLNESIMPDRLPSLSDDIAASKSRAELNALRDQVSILKGQLAQALADKRAAEVAQLQTSDSVAREQIALDKEKDVGQSLIVENDALKAQLAHAEERIAATMGASSSQYEELQKSYDLAQLSLRAAESNVASLQGELVAAKAENQKNAAASDLKSLETDQKFTALLDEKKKVVALEAENQQLKNKMLEIEQDYKGLLAKAKSDHAQLRSAHEVALADLAKVSQESGELKALLAKAEILQKQAETASLSDAQKLEKEFAALLADKERTISVDSDNAALETKIKSLEDSTRQQLASAEAERVLLQKSYDATKVNLEQATQSIAALKGELAQAEVEKQKMAALKAESAGAQAVDHDALAAAQSSVMSLEAENVSLKAQVESLKNSYDVELGALKSTNNERVSALRQKELEVSAMRAEAERQLAEARAVKAARISAAADSAERDAVVPVPSRAPAVVAPVVDSVAKVASAAVQSAGAVVGQAAAVAVPDRLPSLDDAVSVVRSAVPMAEVSADMTQAQMLERGVMRDLENKPRAVSAAVPAPDMEELRSVATPSVAMVEADDMVAESAVVRLPVIDDREPVQVASVPSAPVVNSVVEPMDQPVAATIMDVPAAAEAVVQTPSYKLRNYASGAIGEVLQRANISPAAAVSYVGKVSSEDYQAYEWRADKVFGSAEQHAVTGNASFDDGVLSYLENTEKRCHGDFAIVPASSVGDAQNRVDSYEVACVGQGVSSAAAIVFYQDAGKFTAVAHEAPVDDMQSAMEIRDRLVQTIRDEHKG